LVNFVIAVIKAQTVCLTEIATAFSGRAQIESKYKTLQRFFRLFEIDFDAFATFLGKLINKDIPFSIRIRNKVSIRVLFRNLRRGETRILQGRRMICGVWPQKGSGKWLPYYQWPSAGVILPVNGKAKEGLSSRRATVEKP